MVNKEIEKLRRMITEVLVDYPFREWGSEMTIRIKEPKVFKERQRVTQCYIDECTDGFITLINKCEQEAVREFERLVNNIRRFDDKEDGANYFAGWDNALDTLQTDIKDYLKSKSGGIK